MGGAEARRAAVVLLVSERHEHIWKAIVDAVAKEFVAEVEAGVLRVIVPPQSFFPGARLHLFEPLS